MATDHAGRPEISAGYEFDCESLPIPSGTKSFARLPRGDEPDPIPTRAWWIAGAMTAAALVLGLLLGRFFW